MMTRRGIDNTPKTLLRWAEVVAICIALASPFVGYFTARAVADYKLEQAEAKLAEQDRKIESILETLGDIRQGVARIEGQLMERKR